MLPPGDDTRQVGHVGGGGGGEVGVDPDMSPAGVRGTVTSTGGRPGAELVAENVVRTEIITQS